MDTLPWTTFGWHTGSCGFKKNEWNSLWFRFRIIFPLSLSLFLPLLVHERFLMAVFSLSSDRDKVTSRRIFLHFFSEWSENISDPLIHSTKMHLVRSFSEKVFFSSFPLSFISFANESWIFKEKGKSLYDSRFSHTIFDFATLSSERKKIVFLVSGGFYAKQETVCGIIEKSVSNSFFPV